MYGPCFQGVTSVSKKGGDVWGQISLPSAVSNNEISQCILNLIYLLFIIT